MADSTPRRQRFTADHENLRFFVELLVSGWFAGAYDLETEQWLWTATVSNPDEGKHLILQKEGIDPKAILWNEYPPLPVTGN
jgi:hypothetical protein